MFSHVPRPRLPRGPTDKKKVVVNGPEGGLCEAVPPDPRAEHERDKSCVHPRKDSRGGAAHVKNQKDRK